MPVQPSGVSLPDSGVVDPVVITYEDLMSGRKLYDQIERAYGPGSIGILVISGVPEIQTARNELLHLSYKFANLPDHIKEKYVVESARYNVGWAHGKEKFGDRYDLTKGSYYANAIYDEPGAPEEFPNVGNPNVWPREDLPDLEHAFKRVGRIFFDTGRIVARHLDDYCQKVIPGFQPIMERSSFDESRLTIGRLLHYYPVVKDDGGLDNWCGWHNDNSTITALASSMFLDSAGNEVPCPDPATGLYVTTREGKILKVQFPANCVAFQLGESAQILSGGALVATPHMVRGLVSDRKISREQFAMFIQPNWDHLMKAPTSMEHVFAQSVSCDAVPPLPLRWKGDVSFGKFLQDSINEYYKLATDHQ